MVVDNVVKSCVDDWDIWVLRISKIYKECCLVRHWGYSIVVVREFKERDNKEQK